MMPLLVCDRLSVARAKVCVRSRESDRYQPEAPKVRWCALRPTRLERFLSSMVGKRHHNATATRAEAVRACAADRLDFASGACRYVRIVRRE